MLSGVQNRIGFGELTYNGYNIKSEKTAKSLVKGCLANPELRVYIKESPDYQKHRIKSPAEIDCRFPNTCMDITIQSFRKESGQRAVHERTVAGLIADEYDLVPREPKMLPCTKPIKMTPAERRLSQA